MQQLLDGLAPASNAAVGWLPVYWFTVVTVLHRFEVYHGCSVY